MIKSIWCEFDEWETPFDEEDGNADITFELSDSSKWAFTAITYKNIETLRKKNRQSGECLSGQYFCVSDMVLVERLDKELIALVVAQMIAEGTVASYCSKI